jgi:hypothetical protein
VFLPRKSESCSFTTLVNNKDALSMCRWIFYFVQCVFPNASYTQMELLHFVPLSFLILLSDLLGFVVIDECMIYVSAGERS